MHAVYTNLAQPQSSRAWDPDEGTRAVLSAARDAGVARIVRISTMGCPAWRDRWWIIERKARADDLVRESGLSWTIFRPTWFMESLALFLMGPMLLRPPSPDVGLHWIAGEDYAAQVDAAIDLPAAGNREYVVQGPEAVSIRTAIARFGRRTGQPDYRKHAAIGLAAGAAGSKPRYLRAAQTTWATNVGFRSSETWRDLGEPRLRIEDCVPSRSRATCLEVPFGGPCYGSIPIATMFGWDKASDLAWSSSAGDSAPGLSQTSETSPRAAIASSTGPPRSGGT